MEIERQYILKLRKGANHPTYEIYEAYSPKLSLKPRAQQIFKNILNEQKCCMKWNKRSCWKNLSFQLLFSNEILPYYSETLNISHHLTSNALHA